ncbi:Cysteine proteinase inhibitor 5 [Spatholobus suberectus]|nr:Cysteine proteinase inhibitor 5 [Spatholobus suberectus]
MKLVWLLLVSVVLLASSAVARKEVIVGGWSPIKNINDPHVKEIADFAVTEYDKRSGEKLKLEKVIKGDTQVVAGTNYRLTLAATDGSSSNNYEAVVWEKVWMHFRNLTSFTPVHA